MKFRVYATTAMKRSPDDHREEIVYQPATNWEYDSLDKAAEWRDMLRDRGQDAVIIGEPDDSPLDASPPDDHYARHVQVTHRVKVDQEQVSEDDRSFHALCRCGWKSRTYVSRHGVSQSITEHHSRSYAESR